MTRVRRITDDIGHMPVAAFIFRDNEIDLGQYSPNIRSVKISKYDQDETKKLSRDQYSPSLVKYQL